MEDEPGLYAVSDLHVGYSANRAVVSDLLHPRGPDDWLLVAGDVGDVVADVVWSLGLLADRFARVVWVPGNHELWTPRHDPDQRRGEARYQHLVTVCRELGVLTPEDSWARWEGRGGPVTVAPLFLLYDYSFRAPGTHSKEESLNYARRTGVVCNDEYLLDPSPYPGIDAWCDARIRWTLTRLEQVPDGERLVLVNHFPLVRELTAILHYPEFAQWCGTERTGDWHRRRNVAAVVYGHLHIPRTTWHDGVRFEEVSLGYPRERQHWPPGRSPMRRILPAPVAA